MKVEEKHKKIFATFLICSIVSLFCIIPYIDNEFLNKKNLGPWVLFSDNPAESVIISWESEFEEKFKINYGIDPLNLSQTVLNMTKSKIHHILLSNLTANTKYFYKISNIIENLDNFPDVCTFFTAPNDIVTPFKFIALSDSQQIGFGNAHSRKISNKLNEIASQHKFILNVGDLVGDGSKQSDWDDFFSFSDVILKKTVFVPVIGNHDTYRNLSLKNINDYDKLGNNSRFLSYFPINSNQNHVFYSYNYSMVHFTICDFQFGSDFEMSEEQLNWIKMDLANSQKLPFRIVAFHCPLRSSGFFGLNSNFRNRIKPIMEYYNVSLILNGHDHHYERLSDDTLNYIILGNGGTLQDPHSVQVAESDFLTFMPNYVTISVNQTSIHTKTFTLKNKLIDELVIHAMEGL